MAPLNRSQTLNPSSFIQHFTHPEHPLHLLNLSEEFICNGCSALGFGLRYRCNICNFDLHDICATSPTILSSPLHPCHPLKLVNQPVHDRFCDLCTDLVHGLFYTCEKCEFDVHPLCTQLPLHVKLPQHPQHLLKLQPGSPGTGCAICFKDCTASWRYRCDAGCPLDVHLDCLLEGSGCNDHNQVNKFTCQTRSVLPDHQVQYQQQQVGFGGNYYAMGVPMGGGGGPGYGVPYYNHGVGAGMMTGQQVTGNNEIKPSTSRIKKRRIFMFVGRIAIAAATTSLIGIPLTI